MKAKIHCKIFKLYYIVTNNHTCVVSFYGIKRFIFFGNFLIVPLYVVFDTQVMENHTYICNLCCSLWTIMQHPLLKQATEPRFQSSVAALYYRATSWMSCIIVCFLLRLWILFVQHSVPAHTKRLKIGNKHHVY